MRLKKLCAAFMSVIMSVNVFMGVPPFNPNNEYELSTVSEMMETYTMKAETQPLATTASTGSMRRPLSPEQPMWIVHIDSWNYADPAKIIDLIPEDILPYVVFNISLSINWDGDNKKWLMVKDGYETAKSWIRTCAEKGVWTMIQPSSGGQSHFPDYEATDDLENTIYAEFFRDYPNFIGYNYCEQFWGYNDPDDPYIDPDHFHNPNFPDAKWVTCVERYRHFAALLKLCNKYGGFLDISWCANEWSAGINPIAMLKKIPEWEAACRQYSQNYILEEKFTQLSYISDVESTVYGAYLSGYCGNFGMRYDDSGWSDSTWDGTGDKPPKEQYRVATALPLHIERMAMNGMTVIDGPELVWADDFKELWPSTDSEGYKVRGWDMYDQFQNDMLDMFRKVLDGTIRIPSRKEAIDRTKVAVIQDVNSGNNDAKYSSYPTLFEGLYRMTDDGNLKNNHNPFKCTGRYPTIPTMLQPIDDLGKAMQVQINQSAVATRWPTIEAKQNEFNNLFPIEYWGNIYGGRNENTWLTYNPYKDGTPAGGYFIPKYNTCKQVEVSYSQYTTGVIKEYSDHFDFYLNNYDEEAPSTLKPNTIKIYGATSKPSYTCKNRGVRQKRTEVTENWSNGVYTLMIKENGPIDIRINCSGNETGRLTSYKTAALVEPEFPEAYDGPRQYEAEFFDQKNVEENVTNACKTDIDKCQGQGFLKFGTSANAAVKDTVTNKTAGTANMILRYSAISDINNIDLYVNGTKVKTLSLPKGTSYSDWKTVTTQISLNAGDNKIELKANAALPSSLYLDNFVIE